jgi:hypothetical protein
MTRDFFACAPASVGMTDDFFACAPALVGMTNHFLLSKVDFSPAHNPRPAPVSSFAFPQYPVIMADVFQANEMIGATK